MKPSTAGGGQASVAQRWTDIVNKGDTAGLGALFTDDAAFAGGMPCGVRTICIGPAAIAKRVERAASQHVQQTVSGTPAVVGNVVQWRYEGRNDTAKAAGVERELVIVTVTLRGDKIASLISLQDLSDAQTAKYQAYSQQQAAASAPAKPAASGAAATDPAAVITRWMEALNKGDAAGAAAMWASDGVMAAGGAPCTVTTPCTGGAILARFQASAAGHPNYTLVGSPIVVGNLVQIRRELRNDNAKAAGVDRFVDWHQETVQGDKIATDIGANDISDPQTVKYTQWQQASASSPASAAAKPAAPASAKP